MKTIFLFLFLIYITYCSQEENKDSYNVEMIVNLVRHGARSPSKIRPEMKKHFPSMQPGKLTLNGFRQMVVLGKILRKRYLENKSVHFENFFDINKAKEQFLLISSPYPRAIESGVGYVLGLLPDYIYKIYDINNKLQEDNPIPPLIKENTEEINQIKSKHFNFIIENRDRDVLFHSRKCKFPEHIYKPYKKQKDKNFQFMKPDEKKLVYEFYKQHFNETLLNINLDQFTDKLARSLYTAVRAINFNYKYDVIPIPDDVHLILKRLFAHYLFIKRTDHEDITKITSSPFLEHLIHYFDHKVKGQQEHLDFYELKNFNYTDLKFVSYSGHDYNFVGLIKNLLDLDRVNHYIENIDIYEKLLIIPFASTIDFHLIKDSQNEFFVKIFLNGEELFESIRSFQEGEEIMYDEKKGVPYKIFKKVLNSRIFHGYHECIHTQNK
jgi:hypothetical protein